MAFGLGEVAVGVCEVVGGGKHVGGSKRKLDYLYEVMQSSNDQRARVPLKWARWNRMSQGQAEVKKSR